MKKLIINILIYFVLLSGLSFAIEYFVNSDRDLSKLLIKSLLIGFSVSVIVGLFNNSKQKKREKERKDFEL